MTKTEYCHRVADFNEAIYDTENSIASIESKLLWDDESKRDWYLARLEEEKASLARPQKILCNRRNQTV